MLSYFTFKIFATANSMQ